MEQFAHRERAELLQALDEVAQTSGVSRGQAFEDFLHMSVCALAGGTLEEQYLEVVAKHTAGKPGARGCDRIARLFGQLVHYMEETRQDLLGDLFQGAITYGERGQFFTPDPVCQLMAALTCGQEAVDAETHRTVCDPCCGSGRMLLVVAERQPHWEFFGQDIDLRCVRMTALNLALRNRYGHVIWGDSLRGEQRLIYQTGFAGGNAIREVRLAECPPPVQAAAAAVSEANPKQPGDQEAEAELLRPGTQLRFF